MGLEETLQIEILSADQSGVVARMPVQEAHLQPFGYLHGGASAALAEHAASVGAQGFCPPGHVAFGLALNINHLKKKTPGATLLARARPRHTGRRTQVWEIEIEDEDGELVALARCTLAVVEV